MTKRIVLCADDYGQAEAISAGILGLLAKRRLSAVSCMVNRESWPVAAAGLQPYQNEADIGLHLNFTEGQPLSALYRDQLGVNFMPLSRLLWQTLVRPGSLSITAVTAEINAQLDAFQGALGFVPRFVDGHQHIHHLPVISAALFDVYERRLRVGGTYLRAVTQSWRFRDIFRNGLKNAVIHYTGGGRFAGRLDALEIPKNTSFSGIYDFSEAARYRRYFQKFLQDSADQGLIMCHPGLASTDERDPIAASRWLEYQYFNSDAFIQDCEQSGVTLARLFPTPA